MVLLPVVPLTVFVEAWCWPPATLGPSSAVRGYHPRRIINGLPGTMDSPTDRWHSAFVLTGRVADLTQSGFWPGE